MAGLITAGASRRLRLYALASAVALAVIAFAAPSFLQEYVV
jgi:hypothetical protein